MTELLPLQGSPDLPYPDRLLSDNLVRAGQGDEQAFADIYDATSSRIHGLILRLTDSPPYAEELTHIVYVAIWHQASSYDPKTQHALSWLIGMAHHRAVRQIRSEEPSLTCPRSLFGAVGSETPVPRQPGRSGSPTRLLREILTLFFLGGYPCEQVANRLGVHTTTVISGVAEGLVLLRRFGSFDSLTAAADEIDFYAPLWGSEVLPP